MPHWARPGASGRLLHGACRPWHCRPWHACRYEHGLFRQALVDGWQQEQTENWLDFGNPEFERAEVIYPISFGGSVETCRQPCNQRQVWSPGETVRVAYDTPVVGWRVRASHPCACGGHGRWKSCTWSASTPGPPGRSGRGGTCREHFAGALYPADSTEAGQSCACGGARALEEHHLERFSTPVTTWAQWPEECACREHSRCCTRRTSEPGGCACARNFFVRRHCRTCCAAPGTPA